MKKLFKTLIKQRPIIGMIHFPPLIGYEGFTSVEKIKRRILKEVNILNFFGVHAIMVENNYDIPHKIYVDPESTAMLSILTDVVVKNTKLPVGIDVLWNDYKSAFGICAATGASFIRIPAFIDDVRTQYGDVYHVADDAIAYRKRLHLEHVGIVADVQVKHSEMLDKKKPLSLSVRQAIKKGADGIIITGKWTGDAPLMDHLKIAKENAGSLPILVGSGSTKENLKNLFTYANGIIVGTAIMNSGIINKQKLDIYMQAYKKSFQEKD